MARSESLKWRNVSRNTFEAAQVLFSQGNWRGCANRCYYSAYQAATALCIDHGDESKFPPDWNNPSHEQLPNLIKTNGSLTMDRRRRISRSLRELRQTREDADYRPGATVLRDVALKNLHLASDILEALGIEESP